MSLEGLQLNRYWILRLLGAGRMGEVYLAEDPRVNREVAIKVIKNAELSNSIPPSLETANRLFLREARAIAALQHPNILPLFDYGEVQMAGGPLSYMVMPYYQEGSLENYLLQHGGFRLTSLHQIYHILNQAADALQYAHDQQIVHLDVKLQNFLIHHRRSRGIPDLLLADFGIAKFLSGQSSTSQFARGTPIAMAPEQWEGHPVPATDQYALAIMTYQLLTGDPPFRANQHQLMYQHFNVQPRLPSALRPDISSQIDEIILRALRKQPQERFPSIREFAQAFQQALPLPPSGLDEPGAKNDPAFYLSATISDGGQAPIYLPSNQQSIPPTVDAFGVSRSTEPQASDSQSSMVPSTIPAPFSSTVTDSWSIKTHAQKSGHSPISRFSATSLTLTQMREEMDQAIGDEICEQQKKFKNIKHSASDGKLLSEGNGQYIYQFTLSEPWEPQDDGQLSIATPIAQGIKCTVVTATGTLLTIACERPLPPEVLRQIDLYDDSTELLKRLKEVLKQIDEGDAKLGSKSFGLLNSTQNTYAGEVTPGKIRLRTKQEQAARWSLGGEVTFIVGPPGTGKTLTLAAIALKHLQAGRTVLIAAHTNIAIDNALMKLCEICKGTGDGTLLANGRVVRYGVVQKEELKKNDFYQEVYLPKIIRSLGIDLHTQHAQIKTELNLLQHEALGILQRQQEEMEPYEAEYQELRALMESLEKELHLFERREAERLAPLRGQETRYKAELQQITSEHTRLSQEVARNEASIVEQEGELIRRKQKKDISLTQLVEARSMNKLKLFFKGIKLEKLELKVAEASQSVYKLEQSLSGLRVRQNSRHQILTQCGEKKQAIEITLNTLQRQLSTPSEETQTLSHHKEKQQYHKKRLREIESLRQQKNQQYQQDSRHLTTRQAQLEEQLAEIDRRLRDLEKNIVENACVVGTTLTKTYMNQTMVNRCFDAVIVDEVSMAPLPLVYIAASRADCSVTLIGDPQQLAPILYAETPVAKKWLGEDLFTHRAISLDTAISGSKQSVLLDVQSRTHPDISIIANKYVYDNKLHTEFDTRLLKKIQPVEDRVLILCDTHDGSPTVTRPPNSTSRKNYYHALCCIALARQVLASVPEMKQGSERSIGIVTPYTHQARLLQRLIGEADLQSWVQAGTVYRFQGLEFDVVIFDTVESAGLKPGQYISGSKGSNSMRLINVAVTRPKQKLYIVANLSYIKATLSQESILRLAVEEAAKSSVLPSLDILGTSFSSFVEKMCELSPASDSIQAALAGTLLSHTPPDTYGRIVKDDVLVFRLAEASPTKKHGEPEIKHFTEKAVYAAAKQDIRNACKRICIASPYIAKARLNNVIELLLEKKNKGVHLEIFTRPLDEGENWHREAVQLMLSRGIEPIYKSDMHEKAVIIDGRIMYDGNMNFLSQRSTTNNIYRITNVSVIRDTYEAIRSNKSMRTLAKIDDVIFKNLKEIEIPLDKLNTATKCTCGRSLEPRFDKNDKVSVYFWCPSHSGPQRSFESLKLHHLEGIAELQKQSCTKCGSSTVFDIENVKGEKQRVLLTCSAGCGEMQRITFVL